MNSLERHRAEVEFFADNPGMAFDEGALERKGEVEFAVEQFEPFLPDCKTLLQQHWEEIARDKDVIKLDPNWEQYEWLAKHNLLLIVTARDDGWLVGYIVGMVQPHLHYKSSLTCFTDLFFLQKPYRKGLTGYKLIKRYRDEAKKKGAQKIYISMKLALDIDPLLRRLGFTAIEKVYAQTFK